jgi:hypothetical protein
MSKATGFSMERNYQFPNAPGRDIETVVKLKPKSKIEGDAEGHAGSYAKTQGQQHRGEGGGVNIGTTLCDETLAAPGDVVILCCARALPSKFNFSAPVQLRLGQIHEALGNLQLAITHYTRLARLWEDTETDQIGDLITAWERLENVLPGGEPDERTGGRR